MSPKKKPSEGILLLSVYSDEDDEEMEDAEEEAEEEQQKNEEEGERNHEELNFMDEENGRGEDSRTPNVKEGAASSANATPRILNNDESPRPDWPSHLIFESGITDGERADDVSGESTDALLDQFLPPPPKEKCSEELQRKIDKFLSLRKMGKSFNNEVRNRKEYRNPDFLLHAVSYQDIDQIGSCFNKDVFDPNGYDPSDFCDAIEADIKHERERKEQESKRNQQLEFVSSGTQPGTVFAAPKPNIPIPIPVIPAVATSGLPSIPTETSARDGRPNKKSKWDKVDVDVKNPPPLAPGTQDSISSSRSNAALISASSAGSGYTAFAQQKRREVEGRRSADRKLERRS